MGKVVQYAALAALIWLAAAALAIHTVSRQEWPAL